MDSIKGAIALRDRIGEAAAAAAPSPPSPRVPESAPPIFHWLGVKPIASVLPAPSRDV